jgi:hypothetical protein
LKTKEVKEQTSYLLPKSLKRKVRVAAAESGVWPADYVATVLTAHFDRIASKKPDASPN